MMKDDKMFLFYTESRIQYISEKLIGRSLKPKELTVLKRKIHIEIRNLIIKIGSSGIENEKES